MGRAHVVCDVEVSNLQLANHSTGSCQETLCGNTLLCTLHPDLSTLRSILTGAARARSQGCWFSSVVVLERQALSETTCACKQNALLATHRPRRGIAVLEC